MLNGEALAEKALAYVKATNVISRLSAWMDVEALRALSDGLTLDLDSTAAAEQSAIALKAALHDAEVEAMLSVLIERRSCNVSSVNPPRSFAAVSAFA